MLPVNRYILLVSVALGVSAQEWANFNCVAPRSPTNGMSFIFDDGKRVEFRCHPGFKMVGKSLAVCRKNKWTSQPPICVTQSQNQSPPVIIDDMTTSYPRSVFDWQHRQTEENEEPLSVRYGAGSNRVPIINGLWGYPSHRDSRVLSIVPDPFYGKTVSSKDLMEQEMNIAALRHQMEQDVKYARGIQPKKEDPTPLPYYSPYRINSDGFLVGIGGVNSHPIYYLGASAEHKVDEHYKNTRIGAELAELRRKQIEEARSIQMNTASNRQRKRFQNTLTYGSRDIPVWRGQQNPGGYWTEETVYKPARVGMTKYSEQNKVYIQAPLNDPLIPRPLQAPRSGPLSTRSPYVERTLATTEAATKTQSFTLDRQTTKKPPTSFTRNNIVANIPTPPVLLTEQSHLPAIQVNTNDTLINKTSSVQTRDPSTTVNVSDRKTNYDDFEWPAEALWFKNPTTAATTRPTVVTRPLRRRTTDRSSRSNKSRGKSVNKNRNKKHKEKRPQVTHFSHGRVKSTEDKINRRNKS